MGFSYGTLLGASYLSLFPDRSRAVVLDGNVDPQLRTSNGVEYDRQRAPYDAEGPIAQQESTAAQPDPTAAQQEEDYVDDSYFGVNCTDKPIPRTPELVPGIAAAWERESPTFGRYQAFSDVAACAHWPRTGDVHRGPWRNTAETPALVFGNRYDPATQYEFSERMAHQLGHAELVTVDSFGHCILGQSACADRIAADYSIEQRRPGPGQTCSSDEQPFGAA